jgi:hypothetical protein
VRGVRVEGAGVVSGVGYGSVASSPHPNPKSRIANPKSRRAIRPFHLRHPTSQPPHMSSAIPADVPRLAALAFGTPSVCGVATRPAPLSSRHRSQELLLAEAVTPLAAPQQLPPPESEESCSNLLTGQNKKVARRPASLARQKPLGRVAETTAGKRKRLPAAALAAPRASAQQAQRPESKSLVTPLLTSEKIKCAATLFLARPE